MGRCIEAELLERFIKFFEGDVWDVVRVYASTDKCYFDLSKKHSNVRGAYVVEIIAPNNIHGYDKRGGFTIASKGTVMLYTVFLFNTGEVIADMLSVVTENKVHNSTALTISQGS